MSKFDNCVSLIDMNYEMEEMGHSSSESTISNLSEVACMDLGSHDLVTPPACDYPDETETTLFPVINPLSSPNHFQLPIYSELRGEEEFPPGLPETKTEFSNNSAGYSDSETNKPEFSNVFPTSTDSETKPTTTTPEITPSAHCKLASNSTTIVPGSGSPCDNSISATESTMSATSNNGSGENGHVKVIMTNEGSNSGSMSTPTTASHNQANGQQQFGASILQSQLNAPPLHQQHPNSSTGIQSILSHFHGQGGVGMEPQQQMQQHHHHMQQHFSSQFQQHLMDSQHSHSAPQMNLAQQLPPGSQFNLSSVNHHNQHPQHHPQFMPYGLNSSFANAGHHFGNLGNPQLNPFHPQHISNQQQGVGVVNPMQQPPHCYVPPSCLMNYQQQQSLSLAGPRGAGVPQPGVPRWINGSGNPAMSVGSGPAPINANSRGRNRTSQSSPPPPKVKAAVTPRVQVQTVEPDPNSPPGGLEILWREMHPDCQNLMTQQDIPETAKFRGYFTVCELIALKKTLESRMANRGKSLFASIVPVESKVAVGGKGEKRGPKRGGQAQKGTPKGTKKTKYGENKEKKRVLQQLLEQKQDVTSTIETMHQDRENGSNSAIGTLTIDSDNAKQKEMQNLVPKDAGANQTEVGGAMKAALEVLSSHHQPQSMGNGRDTSESMEDENLKNPTNASQSVEDEHHDTQSDCEKMNDCGGDQAEFAEMSVATFPQFSGFGENTQLQSASCNSSVLDSSAIMKGGVTAASSSSMETLANAAQILDNSIQLPLCHQRPQAENRHQGGPVQMQRTMSLTLRLLEFGPYKIRSFVLSSPNKLKVLFNSQRMTYECQLPLIHSATEENPGPHPLRRTLSIDIGFDQITGLQFKSDSLTMQVEGLPLLQIATTITNEMEPELTLTEDDKILLDQIEKGQLKLNPLHQLYFLNERQVSDLEFQCRGHPELRKFIRA